MSTDAAPGRRPNFLFLLSDQHRADWMPWHLGLQMEAPFRTWMAQEGVNFSQATTPSPLCAPARACLARGDDYESAGVISNQDNLALDAPNYYRSLRDVGYRVGGVGKFDLAKGSAPWKLDGSSLLAEWGFTDGMDSEGKWAAVIATRRLGHPAGPYAAYLDSQGLLETHIDDYERHRVRHWDDTPVETIPGAYAWTAPTPLPEDGYTDNWVAARAAETLEGFPAGTPWHLVVNFPGPHEPLDVTARMRASVAGRRVPPPRASTSGDARAHAELRRNYLAMIENIDRLCADLVAQVRARGELDNTVVIYTSDHGEMLGDHDRWGKSTFYQPSITIPLLIAAPGGNRGVTVEHPVSFQDVGATILDYAGLPAIGRDSRSLLGGVTGADAVRRDTALSGLGDWRLAYDGRYKVVRRAGEQLAFDLESDPCEERPLSGSARESALRALDDFVGQASYP